MDLTELHHTLTEKPPDYTRLDGPAALDGLRTVLRLRTVLDHHAVTLVSMLDRLHVADRQGRSLRELLIVAGCAPAVASRLIRVAASLDLAPRLAAHLADGVVSIEHADAVMRGIVHIGTRRREPLDDESRQRYVTDLVAQVFSGATPAEVAARARTLGNLEADDSAAGVPAGEDRSVDRLDVSVTADGRVAIVGDVDAVIGAKLASAVDALSAPRPQPDGSPDARSATRRRAEALEQVLDAAAMAAESGVLQGMPKYQTVMTMSADPATEAVPDGARLGWVGSVTAATARMLSCDGVLTPIVVDDGGVPLHMGRDKRLFPAHLRKALMVRDGGVCIKCGAPGSWAHAHHIKHWVDGGDTSLDNGCLLCPACHDDVHHHGWQVFLGADRHPWLIPPATVDARRRPLPAYNRRTMRLSDTELAAA